MSCVYAFWELKICGINDGPPAENRPLPVEKMQILKMNGRKKPSPLPTTPPKPYDFIIYEDSLNENLLWLKS